ncbi:hypothetical protein GO730_04725 [Spirosoma sp. HMF3257]|nr:hypothetical protein [Spirosoma telluris]
MNYFLTLLVLLTVTGCQSKPEQSMIETTETVAPRNMAAFKAPSPEQDEQATDQEPAQNRPPPPQQHNQHRPLV